MTWADQTIEIPIEDSWPSHERGRPPLLPSRADADLSGQVLNNRYGLIRRLGHGGMGAVYLAQHILLEKQVAIKVLNTRQAAEKHAIQRFVQEAKATSRLRHENIVDVFDFGASGGHAYLVMEYLEGEDLSTLLQRDGPMPWRRTARILMQVCAALQVAHARRIIHRDIKPSNCFRVRSEEREDWIKVLDFGVAKVLGGSFDDGVALETDIMVGTPEYMAPESLTNRDVDARVDVYAVGMLGYHLLTGLLPFSRSRAGFLRDVCKGVVQPPSKARPGLRIPAIADSILMCALRAAADERFQTMSELGAAIAGGLEQTTPLSSTRLHPESETLVDLPAGSSHWLVRPPAPPRMRIWPTFLSSSIVALLTTSLVWAVRGSPGPEPALPPSPAAVSPSPALPTPVEAPEGEHERGSVLAPERESVLEPEPEAVEVVIVPEVAPESRASERPRARPRSPSSPTPAPLPVSTIEPRTSVVLWPPEIEAPQRQDMFRRHSAAITEEKR